MQRKEHDIHMKNLTLKSEILETEKKLKALNLEIALMDKNLKNLNLQVAGQKLVNQKLLGDLLKDFGKNGFPIKVMSE